ncbi:MAG: hypothetical protein QXN55_07760 [Candidatus Nitrosotenuis sp.]|jgi:hypothetical protein
MNSKISTTSVILALSIASITIVWELSQSDKITAADTPTGNGMYPFAEDVYPVATFKFRDAIVTYDFQLFDTTNNLFSTGASGFTTKQVAPEFTLQRVVGDTPYLHKAVDQTFEMGGKSSMQDYPYKEFDVIVNLGTKNNVFRTFDYAKCSVSNYKVSSQFDKAESFTGKDAFAVLEQYTFVCQGYSASSPVYDKIMEEMQNRKPYQ